MRGRYGTPMQIEPKTASQNKDSQIRWAIAKKRQAKKIKTGLKDTSAPAPIILVKKS